MVLREEEGIRNDIKYLNDKQSKESNVLIVFDKWKLNSFAIDISSDCYDINKTPNSSVNKIFISQRIKNLFS